MTFHDIINSFGEMKDEMMELVSPMISVGCAIGGLGALVYISYRVWRSLANAEPIDVFPLLRPFALGLCIMLFEPLVLGGLDGILTPITNATESIGEAKKEEVAQIKRERDALLEQKKEELSQKWEESHNDWGLIAVIQKELLMLKIDASRWMNNMLVTVLQIAGMGIICCMQILRIFILIVLAILGPIVFGIAIWDGFGSSLTAWLQKYVWTFLWLPVSYILMAIMNQIQFKMIQMDMESIQSYTELEQLGEINWIFIVFYVILAISFMTIPTITGWVVEAGSGAGALGRQATQGAGKALSAGAGMALGAGGGAMQKMGQAIGGKAGNAMSGIGGKMTSMAGSLSKGGASAGSAIGGAVGKGVGSAGKTVGKAMNETGKHLADKIVNRNKPKGML